MAVITGTEVSLAGITTEDQVFRFAHILSFYLESDRFTPADLLEFSVLDEIGTQKIKAVRLEVQGKRLFDGIVDVQRRVIGRNGAYSSFVCRSNASLMLDNEVKPYYYIQLNSDQLMRNHMLRYGVRQVDFPHFATVSSILANKGSSQWAFVELFCKIAYQKSPYMNRDGIVSCTPFQPHLHRFSNRDADAVRFLDAEIVQDRYQMISALYVKTGKEDAGGTYNYTIQNKGAQGLGVQRERYYHPGREWEGHIALSGQNYLEEHQMNYFEVRLKTAGIHDIQVGDSAEFDDGGGWYQNLYVSQVRLSYDSAGCTTQLKLWNKRALLDA